MISKKNRTSTQISPAMKKLLASLFFVFTTLFTYGQQFHVASYNVRYANPADEQRGNGWSQRCPVICNQIAYESFDLVGMQEVLKSQFDDLSNRLSRDYGCIGVGRNDGKTSGEYAPIFYKKDRFILLDSGCFWLSETPDKPSVGWDAKYPRICSWAQLQDRNTGNYPVLPEYAFRSRRKAGSEGERLHDREVDPQAFGLRRDDSGRRLQCGSTQRKLPGTRKDWIPDGLFRSGTHSHGCHRNGQRIRPAEIDRPAYRPRSGHSRHRSPPLRFANEPLLVGGLRGKSGSPPAVGPLSRQRIPNDSVTHIRFPREIHGRCSDRQSPMNF